MLKCCLLLDLIQGLLTRNDSQSKHIFFEVCLGNFTKKTCGHFVNTFQHFIFYFFFIYISMLHCLKSLLFEHFYFFLWINWLNLKIKAGTFFVNYWRRVSYILFVLSKPDLQDTPFYFFRSICWLCWVLNCSWNCSLVTSTMLRRKL